MAHKRIGIVMALAAMCMAASADARPIVLELFTSQGCSSCPPADALLASMESDTSLLPLSLHVDYWNRLGWKDPMAARALTQRQYAYASVLGKSGVFTPQLMVDGRFSVVGSDAADVKDAIAKAQQKLSDIALAITPVAGGKQLQVQGAATGNGELPATAQVLAFYFTRHAATEVTRGENGGRTLTSINNVSRIETLPPWQAGKAYRAEIAAPASAHEGVAVIIQREGTGAILGAAKL